MGDRKRSRSASAGDTRTSGRLFAFVVVVGLSGPVWAQEAEVGAGQNIPPLRELEAGGAVIGEIRIANENIFDLDDPNEDGPLFRLANWLHIRTRPSVIERGLLFKRGDPLSVRLLDETERLLRNRRFLYDVSIEPTAYRDGIVDLEVRTRDTWTLDPGIRFSRQGGRNSSGISLKEKNLLGTGMNVAYSRTSDVDRSGDMLEIGQQNAFDGWTELRYAQAKNDDGERSEVSVKRPFYALDTRWTAGAISLSDDRIDSVYRGGNVAAQFRHHEKRDEVFAGWSAGLKDGWVSRYTAGLLVHKERFAEAPGFVPPPVLPADEHLVAPYLAYELIEDDTAKLRNRNQVARAEYFSFGFNGKLQINRATTALGSGRNAWLYEGRVSRGSQLADGEMLFASASLSGQYGDEGISRQQFGVAATYYRPHGDRSLFFLSTSFDTLKNPRPSEFLQLGGENGLRGFPLRYQTGEKRILVTVEERRYTDLYLFRLFRIGGAIYGDIGRAWDGAVDGGPAPRWRSDIGIGLRIFNSRTAFGNVMHADLAFPLNPEPGIKKVQFLLTSKVSF